MNKKQLEVKTVHRFTENAQMKFRPIYFQVPKDEPVVNTGIVGKMSSIFEKFFSPKVDKVEKDNAKPKAQSKSEIIESPSKNKSTTNAGKSAINENQQPSNIAHEKDEVSNKTLLYLQKITIDTFLIGNAYQLDLLTISGIYDNNIDTDLNWSLNIKRPISKLSVDTKKCLMALQSEGEIIIYRYDNRKLKAEPSFVCKTKFLGEIKFLIFLKDSQIGAFYDKSATIYQIEESNTMRRIFSKSYGVNENQILYQIPKPIQSTLNIFFTERSHTLHTHVLWRLQLDFKAITNAQEFKPVVRVYDIPNSIVNKFKIDNFSRDTLILNFQFEILAAKDGFIIDTANINIQESGSSLIYHGDYLLHISETKLLLYSFKIQQNTKPKKIDIKSLDSIEIKKQPQYMFFNFLEMLNGNFVLFFQIKPTQNHKLKGQIDYLVTVTQKLSIQQKLDQIFSFKNSNELKEMAENAIDKIHQKADIAFKIGLTRKQVYLELWNKSNKSDIQDYKFLLDTMNYETIKQQIQKKLKKNSMTFNEVYKLEQGCYEMLRQDLFSNSNCSQNSIKNFLISHFLLRKLAYFRDLNVNNPANMKNVSILNKDGVQEVTKAFCIDIQQYFHCVKLELKSHFIEYVTKICFEQKNCENQIRLFLKSFKFPLRIIYTELLQDLIIQSKSKLVVFLKKIPEILPYKYQSGQDQTIYEGLWSQINRQEWGKNLHIQEISTIYNKDFIEEITKTVWFKRNKNSLHDLVAFSKQKIIQIQQHNDSENIFYFFIDKIFLYSKVQDHLVELVDFIEKNYSRLPAHLQGKIFLYRKLYNYFIRENHPSFQISTFDIFLKLKDYELFKELFKYEKLKKGCLLKDAKNIYLQIKDGIQLYHKGLLNYFASDLSEISDLKYILNRLNNEKREFHIANEPIYTVLVTAMQMKLKMGSEEDVPLDDVMIYIENIPLSKNNQILKDLQTLQKINQQADRFKKMKLNMSYYQILNNCEDVITAIVNEQIREKKVLQIRDQQELKEISYGIIAEIQTVKDKIYKGAYPDLQFFLYLSKIMQKRQMIKYADVLLKDEYLLDYYSVDERIIENLVLYLYKWKFSKNPSFKDNQQYLRELLSLLHEESDCRHYINSQIQFALMLSTQRYPIQYPLTEDNAISTQQVAEIINNFQVEDIMKIDIVKLHGLIKEMQYLCVEYQMTNIQEIYEVVILRLLNLNDVKHSIPLVRKLIELYGPEENYAVSFCFNVLTIIMHQMSDGHSRKLLKIAFYTFRCPHLLLDIIEKRLKQKFSNDEEQVFLDNELQNVKILKCYNKQNILFDESLIKKLNEKQDKYYLKLQELIFQTCSHLNNSRQDFNKNLEYTYFYIMLLNNPYCLAKYLTIKNDTVNIRLLRSYLSYIFREDIFNGNNVLLFGRRMFTIVLNNTMNHTSVEALVSQYKGNDLADDQSSDLLSEKFQPSSLSAKLQKSILAFDRKIQSQKLKINDSLGKKKYRVEALLSSQASINENQISDYPFQDSDDNYEDEEEKKNIVRVLQKKKQSRGNFDPNKQRQMIMTRQNKNIALYLSSNSRQDFELRRTSPRILKSTKFGSVNYERQDGKKTISGGQYLSKMMRAESIGISHNNQYITTSQNHQNDDNALYHTATGLLKPQNLQNDMQFYSKSYSPSSSGQLLDDKSNEQQKSPLSNRSNQSPLYNGEHPHDNLKIQSKDSFVEVKVLWDSVEIQNPNPYQFKVTIQQINDEQYTAVKELTKNLMQDYGDNENQPMFNLSLIVMQEYKQFDDFNQYLKELITCIYQYTDKPLSFLLILIKQISNHYPQLNISNQFLQYYIALQNHNLKYKSQYQIREMFPIEGIFLNSKDPMKLFQFVKNNILSIVQYDQIVIISQLIINVLKKNEIKDQLYLSYIAKEIEQYGNDTTTTQPELKMQKERIEGMLPQITLATLIIERGQSILKSIAIKERRVEVAEIIKDALKKKKKDYLIPQFEKRIANALNS